MEAWLSISQSGALIGQAVQLPMSFLCTAFLYLFGDTGKNRFQDCYRLLALVSLRFVHKS